jgi:hypothetical protein
MKALRKLNNFFETLTDYEVLTNNENTKKTEGFLKHWLIMRYLLIMKTLRKLNDFFETLTDYEVLTNNENTQKTDGFLKHWASLLVFPPYRGEGVWVCQGPWELYQR